MKKITSFAVLFFSLVTAAHAQQTQKISNAPAYDNINNDHAIKHVVTPRVTDKYALIDNSGAGGNCKKQDETLFKIHGTTTPAGPYDIKKVTFPKSNYLMP